jgi:hypothetical protein
MRANYRWINRPNRHTNRHTQLRSKSGVTNQITLSRYAALIYPSGQGQNRTADARIFRSYPGMVEL